jgi:hypothetical protein
MDILDCGATDAASGVLRITGLAAWGALPMYSRLDWRETELLLWVPGLDRTPRTLDLSSGSEHSMNWRLPPHGSLRVFLPDELLPIGEDPPAYVLDSETYAGARLALVGKGEWLAPVLGLGRKLKLRIGELRREIQGPTRAGEEMRFDLRDPERTALWLHFEGASDRELSRLTCSLRNDDYVMFEGRYDEFLHTALFRWLPVGQRLELTASIPDPQGRNGRRQVRHQLATPEKPGGIEHYTIDLSR